MDFPLSQEKFLYIILAFLLITWFISLLAVYPPTSGWVAPTVPVTIDYHYKLLIFFALTASASTTYLIAGIHKIRSSKQ